MANLYAEHHRLVANGTLGSGAETFSIGVRLKHRADVIDDNWADGDVQDYLDQVGAPAFAAFFSNPGTKVSLTAAIHEVLLYQIRPDGNRNQDHIRAVHRFATPVTGAQLADSGPAFQLSLVVTLEAQGTITRDGRYSRMFLPQPISRVSPSSGRIPADDCASVAIQGAKFVNALSGSGQGLLGSTRVVAAGSKHVRNNAPDGPGNINNVNVVRVGDVLDTQRRRTNSLSENYSVARLDDAAVTG